MATPDRPEVSSNPTPEKPASFVPEEIDSSKVKLPPWRPIAVVLVGIFIVMAIVSYVTRPKPKGLGTIDEVYAVALPDNSVLVTVKMNIKNVGKKPMWVRNLKVRLVTQKGEFTDDAASAVDFPRYFQAFPDLQQHTIRPITVEDKITPGAELRGSVMASFSVPLDEFNARKSISVIVEPYDQGPVTITK